MKNVKNAQGFCVSKLINNGLRISEIFNKYSERSCLLQSRDNKGQLNKKSLCLSCQSAINTLKHTQIS